MQKIQRSDEASSHSSKGGESLRTKAESKGGPAKCKKKNLDATCLLREKERDGKMISGMAPEGGKWQKNESEQHNK